MTAHGEPQRADAGSADKRLISASLSSMSGRSISVLASLATVAIAARALNPTEFGVLATLTVVVSVLGVLDLGIGSSVLTLLPPRVARGDVAGQQALLSSIFAILTALGLLVAATGVMLAIVLPWSDILGAPDVEGLRVAIVVVSASLGLAIVASAGPRVLFAVQQATAANTCLAAGSLTALGASAVAALAQAGLVAFVVASTGLPAVVVLATALTVLRRTNPRIWPSIGQFHRKDARLVLGLGRNLFIIGFAAALAYQTDTLVVSAVLGAASAGVYAIALRMFGLITGLLGSVMSPYWAAFSEAVSLQQGDWLRSRFRLVMVATVGASAVLAVALVLLGPSLARLWVGEAYVPPRQLLAAMAVWTVYAAAMSQASVLLNAIGVVRPQALMATAMLAVNIPVSIGLTTLVGLPGPVLGSLLAHIVCAGAPTIVLVRRAFTGQLAT